MTRWFRLAAAVAALTLGASACESGQAAGDGDVDLPDPVVETEVTTPIDYVAMGDSFSAGPFVGTMRTDPQGCARSKDNYPAFVADWLDVASYTDVTCSAATTADLYDTMVLFDGGTAPAQLDALSAETDLVTLGIGGNDFGIYDSLIQCQRGPAAACPVDQLRADTGKVADRVQQAVRSITEVAPDAEVLVVGYPDILPSEGTCRAVGVPAEVLAPVAEVADLLNASLRRGARAAGASYVDMAAVSDGHDVCAKGRAWVNGPRFRAGVAAPFHPKVNGMRAVAVEVVREVTGEDPEEVTEYAEPDPDVIVLNEG
ncbi:MAG TPA: SGNH/GDSL hydrolase family protein [Nocardioides sp.]|nr:SGNH/GDSL hydrolase family protein [Nocardioides sp.]